MTSVDLPTPSTVLGPDSRAGAFPVKVWSARVKTWFRRRGGLVVPAGIVGARARIGGAGARVRAGAVVGAPAARAGVAARATVVVRAGVTALCARAAARARGRGRRRGAAVVVPRRRSRWAVVRPAVVLLAGLLRVVLQRLRVRLALRGLDGDREGRRRDRARRSQIDGQSEPNGERESGDCDENGAQTTHGLNVAARVFRIGKAPVNDRQACA